jgi:hypothetical protein
VHLNGRRVLCEQMVNPLRAVSAAPTPKTVHFIAFVQQRFRKV